MRNMQLSSEEEQLIREHRKVKNSWKPKAKEDFTTEEKIAFFDDAYESACRILREKEQTGRHDDDESQWAFESMMNLLGPGIWPYFNGLD